MITSGRQRSLVSKELKVLKEKLNALGLSSNNLPAQVIQTLRIQLDEDIANFSKLIEDYDSVLETDTTKPMFVYSFEAFKRIPITCRLANKLTVSDFASIIDINRKTVDRYEERIYQQCDMDAFESIILSLKKNGLLGEVILNLGTDDMVA